MQTQKSKLVKICDSANNVIGEAARGRVFPEKLWYRVSYSFVVTTGNELLVQVRSECKDYCPGFFDLASAGGLVDAGEDDHFGAARELQEELGLSNVGLKYICTTKY